VCAACFWVEAACRLTKSEQATNAQGRHRP
jgi:hypothetical protein